MLRRVLIVNTLDHAGGAEVSSRSILDGFQALGSETQLAVGIKRGDDPRVVPFAALPHVNAQRDNSPRKRDLLTNARRRLQRELGLEDFEHPDTWRLLELAGGAPDLVLLVNLHGDYFDLRALPWLSRRVPVVVSLRDSWLFTGHCAAPPGCPRWETGCGACPDLAIPPAVARDATHLNWLRKRRILAASRLAVMTPSHWLMDRAQRSILRPAIVDAKVVPNGVDLDVFAPRSRHEERLQLGLDPSADILLFVAHQGRANTMKDYPTLRAAVAQLAHDRGAGGNRLELLVVGHAGPLELLSHDTRIRHLPACEQPAELARLYRAADLYVHAAPEETFCNTAAEALACGTPVVAACAGGIREVVEHGRTGLHVPPSRPRELAEAVGGLLADGAARERMGAAAARTARERFDRVRNIAELHSWCAEVASRWASARP